AMRAAARARTVGPNRASAAAEANADADTPSSASTSCARSPSVALGGAFAPGSAAKSESSQAEARASMRGSRGKERPCRDAGVVVCHRPRMLAPVVLAGREARRDASGDPEIAQHQRHRTGEVLAVAATRLRDEGSERRDAGDLGRPLVVLEGSGAEPALELEG